MQDIRLIALDLDGTFFDDEKRASPRTMAALRAALARGVDVLPATGRTAGGVPAEFLNLPGVRYALTSNGASVVELATGRPLVKLPFDAATAERVYDVVSRYESGFALFVGERVYTDAAGEAYSERFSPPALRPYLRSTREVVGDIHALIRQNPDGVEKFSIMYADAALRDRVWREVAAACPAVEITSSIDRNLEINAPGVNKGRGLAALAGALGLSPAQVMACGDSGNDLEMIRYAGLGVAMGNATDEVKAAARYVTLDNNHDGVAAAIEKFVLQPCKKGGLPPEGVSPCPI